MAVRVAAALDLLTVLRIPWLFETPAIHAGQVSMAHLDEFSALLKMDGVQHMIGVQCPFGAQSSKPTSWIYYRKLLEGMPTKCEHQKRTWHNDRGGVVTFSRHMPTAGRDTHSLTPQSPMQFGIRRVTPWDSEQSSPYISEGACGVPRPAEQIHRCEIAEGCISSPSVRPDICSLRPRRHSSQGKSHIQREASMERSSKGHH